VHLVDAVKYLLVDLRDAGGAVRGRSGYAGDCGGDARGRGGGSRRAATFVWIEKMVTKPEAIELYSNCRVFCCPSVYEPFGIINLEAMACGAPVVASAWAGFWRWWWMARPDIWCRSSRIR
jgi:glycosyltransferase involved in cell wall biosynthesis